VKHDSRPGVGRSHWTVAAFAEELGLERPHITKLCRDGLLDAVHVGRLWLIPIETVERVKRQGAPHAPMGPKGGSMHGSGGGFAAPPGGSSPATMARETVRTA
jgi:excisionase family DNA binding protein